MSIAVFETADATRDFRAAAFCPAARRLRVAADFPPAALRFRVTAAFFAAGPRLVADALFLTAAATSTPLIPSTANVQTPTPTTNSQSGTA
jgi:hypothetical protein